MSSEEIELGPIDVVVIGYPADAPRTGEAIPLFLDLVDRGIVHVLDVLAVAKAPDGSVSSVEISDLGGDHELVVFQGARTGMLDDEDAATAAAELEPGESAVMICFENTWAAPFATAVRRNGGRMIAFHRVGAADIIETMQALDAAS